MSDMTIPARLVAEGVGLPDIWKARIGNRADQPWWVNSTSTPTTAGQDYHIDLSDPQTAFGCALKLDAWEWAGDPDWGVAKSTWAEENGARHMSVLPAMIARLRAIGEDAMIRRALWWKVEAGALMQIFQTNAGDWVLMCPITVQQRRLRMDGDDFPFLAGITDPDEARTAIWREVCGG